MQIASPKIIGKFLKIWSLIVKSVFQTTAKNTLISPNFLMWKFCGKTQLPQSFTQYTRNTTKTARFDKISTLGN